MKDINNFSRRKFMSGMAKAGAMLPFAGSMLSQNTFAAGAGFKNVLFFYHPNGVQPSSWNPNRTGSIVGVTDELSFGLGPLKNWHNNMIVFKNIYIDIENPNGGGDGGGHKDSMKGCLTGDKGSGSERASIDVMIAQKLNQEVLSVGVRTGNSSIMKASKPQNVGNDNRPTPNQNPFDVATKLDAKVSPIPADPLQTKVYEAALADLTALSSGDLSLERKAKIEQHKAALNSIKNKQQQGTKKVEFDFTVKETLNDNESISGKTNAQALFAQFPDLCKAQVRNIVAAFANGVHQVATLQLGAGDENGAFINYSFDECWDMVTLAQTRGVADAKATHNRWHNEHTSHTASHQPDWYQSHAQVRWHNSLLAYTLEQLQASGILDETLVVTISDEGDGAAHTLYNGSIVLAGGTGGGALSMGKIIDCGGVAGGGTHKLFGDISKLVGAPITAGPWKSGIIT